MFLWQCFVILNGKRVNLIIISDTLLFLKVIINLELIIKNIVISIIVVICFFFSKADFPSIFFVLKSSRHINSLIANYYTTVFILFIKSELITNFANCVKKKKFYSTFISSHRIFFFFFNTDRPSVSTPFIFKTSHH